MRRREFLSVLAGSAMASPHAAVGQSAGRSKRIGLLLGYGETDPEAKSRLAAFQADLNRLGWADGVNIQIDIRWFGGDGARAKRYAKELIDLEPAVVVAHATLGIEAMLAATQTVPTIFVMVGNPVGSGYIANMARPGGNVTGFSAFEPEIAGKWLQAIKEIAPATRQVSVLFYPNYDFLWRGAEAVAASLKLTVTQSICHTEADIEPAIARVASQPNRALLVLPTPLFSFNRNLIVQSVARHALPAIYPFRFFPAAGGLMSYGFDQVDVFRRSASYVDRILKGEKPADLPAQAPTKFELVINLKTAKALNLTVPPALLVAADEVIE